MHPVIGITCSTSVSVADPRGGRVYEDCVIGHDYVRGVLHAGGTPIVLPNVDELDRADEYLDKIDGLLLSGGVDMDPLLYGEEPHPLMGTIDIRRDRFEMRLIEGAIGKSLPIFAICRGIQMINATLGGTLYQDISQHGNSLLKHRQNSPKWHGSHTIEVQPQSLLSKITGHSEWCVNSFHHQAVKTVAPGFAVSAVSKDGLIEAIESTEKPFVLGVQFHPEMMWQHDPTAASLFRAFVEASKTP